MVRVSKFNHHNLVFCNLNGRPIESSAISRSFNKLIQENDLPKVVFHSLRHSSITYKLKLNGGDVKSVQGDSGHSQSKMITDTYAHILDDDRKFNAQKLEETFYNKNLEKKNYDLHLNENNVLNSILSNTEFVQKLKFLFRMLPYDFII